MDDARDPGHTPSALGSTIAAGDDAELRFFFDASPLLMGAVELLPDGDLRHLYDNPASNRFFGLPSQEPNRCTARERGVPEPIVRLWRGQYEAAGRAGYPVHFDYRHEPREGGARLLAVTVAPLPGRLPHRFSYVAEDVTERRRTEENLKRQETRLDMALEAAKLGDWSWDAATDLITFSPRAAAIFGVEPGAHLTWEQAAAFIPEEDRARARALAVAAAAGQTYEIEYRVRRPRDGVVVWVGVRGRAIFDAQGRMIARVGMAWDQTRLKTIEAQLREALESTTDSIFVLSPDWRFTYLNQRAVAQIADGRELVGQNVWDAFPDAVGGPLHQAYQRCMRERVPTVADQFYDPLGRHFASRAFPTSAGGITVFFRDVTDDLAAAARLAEVEGTLRTLGEATPDLLYAKDRHGRMIYANPACLAVIGLPLEDVIGRTDAETLRNPAEGEAIVRNDRAIMEAGVSRTVIEPVTDKRLGEVRLFQSIKTPLRDPATGRITGLVGIARDVTDQQRAEAGLAAKADAAVKAREAVQERLVQAEKLTALGQLAGGIAHDVNNVMQAVLGAASLIQRRAADPGAVSRLAGMVTEAAQRGASLTRRLLAFARRGELKAEAIEPGGLLESLREVLAHTLGSHIAIDLEVAADLPAIQADRGQLETALINLATNARDAMPDGGRLSLRAELAAAAPGDPAGLHPGRYVRFTVEDTGSGIPAAILPRIWEPFFTTKAQDKGTGLGLPMARSFAEQSGGALTLDSRPGRGTVVHLFLPVTSAPAGSDALVPPPASARPAARILLADDEYLVRVVIAEQLRDEGFTVIEAVDGVTALALIESGEPFDALVSDRAMPGLDGAALIRQARALRPGLAAILLTGFAGEADEVSSSAYSVLRKPITGAGLAACLAALLAAQTPA